MRNNAFRLLIVFVCITLLFTGCRARIIGDKNSADKTTVNPKITSEQFKDEPETTTQKEETATTESNKEVIILDNKITPESSSVRYVYGSGGRYKGVSAYRAKRRPSSRRIKRTTTTTAPSTTTTAPAKKKTTTTTTTTTKPSSNAVKYTVSFNSNGGWGKTKSRKLTANQTYGEEFPKVYNKKGYTFIGWFDSKSGGRLVKNTDKFTYNKDITLYAHWKYDASVFWRNYLISANLYPCQILNIYIEFDEDNKTTDSSQIITLTRSVNAAENSSTMNPTDAQIKALGCDIIVKVVSDFDNAEAHYNKMKSRFSYKPVYILPRAAEFGTKDEQTYYALLLSEMIYEKGFTDFDKAKCSKELKLSGSIYTK